MPTLWVPESQQQRAAEAANAEQRQMLDELEHVAGKLEYYNQEVKKIDPHLRVVMAKPATTVEGLKPGYYHVVRLRPGHPAYIMPVEGPNGEWRDLDSGIFEQLAREDMWNDRALREQRQKARRAAAARDRQRERERQDRVAEINARLHSLDSTQILVPRSVS